MSDDPPQASNEANSRPSADELVTVVYDELRRLAQHLVLRFQPGQTIQPTMLVHEAYMKLANQGGANWNSKRHFYGVAAQAMRSVLIDYVRAKRAQKRVPEGGSIVALDELVAAYRERAGDLEDLDDALRRLGEVDEHLAECIELRFFAGLAAAEISELTGRSQRSIERDLLTARQWLARAMQ